MAKSLKKSGTALLPYSGCCKQLGWWRSITVQYVRQRSRCGRASAQGLEQQFSSLAGHENHLASISNTLVPSRKSESVPLWTFSQVACTLRGNDFSFTFCHFVCLSLSLLHTHKIHIHAYTRTPSWLFHTASEQQGARLFLAAALSSSCIRAGAQLHRGTRREQREALLASTPTSFPPLIAIPKGDQDPNKTEGFHKDQYPTSLQLLDSDFSEPHSYKINPKLPMLLVSPMVQIP